MFFSPFNCNIVNTLWKAQSYPVYKQFLRVACFLQKTQEDYLLNILRRNSRTVYGNRYAFKNIASAVQFRDTVPLTTYKDYLQYIDKISNGDEGVLTFEKVKLFEPTSGSCSAQKLIPYTDSLRSEFQRGIAPWLYTLFDQYPEIKWGKAFWSITPAAYKRTLSGCITVGFDEDSSYLGFLGKWFYSMVAVQPQDILNCTKMETLQERILLSLLINKNLRLISIWSPTYLTMLCEYFMGNFRDVLKSLASSCFPGAKRRAQEIRDIGLSDLSFKAIWPHLAFISCWIDGPSKIHASKLQSYFPGVTIQGKGLLATEAFVSFPFLAGKDPVLSCNSHFFEFLTSDGTSHLAHEVKQGETYSVVVTTGGGLYRYQLGDYIKVTGFWGDVPTLKFTGKSEDILDLFGEKLHPMHVSETIDSIFSEYSFAMLAPEQVGGKWTYTLFVESKRIPTGVEELLNKLLSKNHNYHQCIITGQLQPARVFQISKSAIGTYTERMLGKGLKLGDIKLSSISRLQNWNQFFVGKYTCS